MEMYEGRPEYYYLDCTSYYVRLDILKLGYIIHIPNVIEKYYGIL